MKKIISFDKAAKIATGTISKLLSLLVILALIIGTARIFLDMQSVFEKSIDAVFKTLVTDILGMIVALELFRGLTDYLELHRVRLTIIVEVTLVFVLREVMISLYQHKMVWQEMLAMSVLIAVLGALRTLAIVRSPGKLNDKGV